MEDNLSVKIALGYVCMLCYYRDSSSDKTDRLAAIGALDSAWKSDSDWIPPVAQQASREWYLI
jgi:hypothetical protein